MQQMQPKIILVVCNGNIHRSVIAEHCLKQSLKRHALDKEFVVVSRGIQGTCGTDKPKGKYEDVPDCFGSNDKNLHREVVMLIDRVSNECIDVLLG